MRRVIIILFFLISFACSGFSQSIANGGFALPDISGSFQTLTSAPTDFVWDITGRIDLINSYWDGASGSDYDQSVDIDETSSISQAFATVAGTRYSLDFWYANNPDGTGSSTGYVSVLGAGSLLSDMIVHNTSSLADMDFFNYTGEFTADSTSAILSFAGDSANGLYGIVIDDISISAVSGPGPGPSEPVPEPATLLLLGTGLLGLAGAGKRNRSL